MEINGNIISGYYGTWKLIEKMEYNGNKAFLVESEKKYSWDCNFEPERLVVTENNTVLSDYEGSYDGFKKYIDDLEFYYGGSLRRC